MEARSSEKRRRLEGALERGVVFVHLDARRPGVVVPQSLRNDHQLTLKLSYRFDPPDLFVGDWGVRETLSFQGDRFAVAVPWSAIFAITGSQRADEAWLYPEDMPRELFEAAAQHFGLNPSEVTRLREEAGIDAPAESPAKHGPARGGLKVVETESAAPDAGTESAAPDAGTESAAPDAGTESAAPDAGTESAAPDAGTESAAPDAGTESAAPDDGTKSAAPDDGTKSAAPDDGTSDAPKSKRGHLRLVK